MHTGKPTNIAAQRLLLSAALLLCARCESLAQSLVTIPPLAGDSLTLSPTPNTLSIDGVVWVGLSARTAGVGDPGRSRGLLAAGSTFTDLGVLPGWQDTIVTAIDYNGQFIVGRCIGGSPARAFVYTRSTYALAALPLPIGATSTSAQGISGDGNVIFGTAVISGAYRYWRYSASLFTFATLPPEITSLTPAASTRDGSLIVGSAVSAGAQRAFLWNVTSQPVLAPMPPGYLTSAAACISADGSVIAGRAALTSSEVAVVWSNNTVTVLPALRATDVVARAVAISADGSVIAGESADVSDDRVAWIHTQATGIRRLDELLYIQGVDISGWTLRNIGSISADGTTVSGTGIRTLQTGPATRAFIATLRTFCPVDWNADGGIDGADVDAYFADWEQGVGDINIDGAVDGGDVQEYFSRWSLGLC